MTMALLGLLAYKALKSSGGLGNVLGSQPAPAGTGRAIPLPPGGTVTANNMGSGGGLGGLLGGLFGGGPSGAQPGGSLGGLIPGLGGAAAGNVLSGGLGNLIKDLENS